MTPMGDPSTAQLRGVLLMRFSKVSTIAINAWQIGTQKAKNVEVQLDSICH